MELLLQSQLHHVRRKVSYQLGQAQHLLRKLLPRTLELLLAFHYYLVMLSNLLLILIYLTYRRYDQGRDLRVEERLHHMQQLMALVVTPALFPKSTIVLASAAASSGSLMNAPEPVFTSSTNALVPSAIFLLIIEDAINGIASTVPVTSRKA